MDLSQKQNIIQTMRQEQTMTHQQIQALELLFLPALELEAAINSEIEKNPVLEIEKTDDVPEMKGDNDGDEWLDKVLQLEDDKRYIRSGSHSNYSEETEEKRQHYLDSITAEQSFQEFLLEQLKFLDMDDKLREACEAVISGLDDDGYLTSHPADLAMATGQSLEVVREAVGIVQQLEPAGVAAPDLRGRLMLQLERQGRQDEPVYTAVSKYLDEIAANHLPQVARSMKVSLDELKEIIHEIQALNPRLTNESVSPHEYIREEVVVEENEDGSVDVKMSNEHLPNLYISKHYRDLLNDPNTPKETRDYIKEKLHAGVFLINSIIQRQTTIRKIVNALVEYQEDYFTKGRDSLKPLTMAQIADKVGIHETTVSRAVAGKYLRCKYGLIPIRNFFTSGYQTEDGQSVSKNVVMDVIKEMIDNEDPYKPLSDSTIVKELKEKGYNVARRTVAKYRDQMNILPSNLRRQY